MGRPPWYHEGLQFQCLGCGDCCTGEPGFVWVGDAEIERLARELGVAVVSFLETYVREVHGRRSLIELEDGDCVFFDGQSRKCKVYRARPGQCRTWPFWRSNLRTRGDWSYVERVCPGAGAGPLVPLETIQSRAAGADE